MNHKLNDIVITTAGFFQMEGRVCKVIDLHPLGYVRGKVITCEDYDGKRYTAGRSEFITPSDAKDNKYGMFGYVDWDHDWLKGVDMHKVSCCDQYKQFKYCPECGTEIEENKL